MILFISLFRCVKLALFVAISINILDLIRLRVSFINPKYPSRVFRY